VNVRRLLSDFLNSERFHKLSISGIRVDSFPSTAARGFSLISSLLTSTRFTDYGNLDILRAPTERLFCPLALLRERSSRDSRYYACPPLEAVVSSSAFIAPIRSPDSSRLRLREYLRTVFPFPRRSALEQSVPLHLSGELNHA